MVHVYCPGKVVVSVRLRITKSLGIKGQFQVRDAHYCTDILCSRRLIFGLVVFKTFLGQLNTDNV